MKFTCEKYKLQEACQTVMKAVASKSTIPALEGILIEADDSIKVTGYDLKEGIYTFVEAGISERGRMVFSSRLFSEIIRKMPDGTVSITADEKTDAVQVKCGKSEFNFIGISAEDYPEMPDIEDTDTIEIPQNILKSMINQTIFAIATNDSRPVYTGILFDIDHENLTLVSVDGYRLAKRCETIEGNEVENKFIVPGSALSDLEKICQDTDEKVKICAGSKHVIFYIGDTVLISRRLEGDFLNYKRSIPETFKYVLTVKKQDIMQTVERVSLIISEKNSSPVKMTVGDGEINCVCVTPLGKAEDTCYCEGSGEDLEIGFNDRYLMDAFKYAGKDTINVCFNTSSTPCVIKAADGTEKFTNMILPVRLRAGK